MNSIKKIAVLGFIVAAISVLAACGTVNGFGKDVSTVGHDVQKAAH